MLGSVSGGRALQASCCGSEKPFGGCHCKVITVSRGPSGQMWFDRGRATIKVPVLCCKYTINELGVICGVGSS